MKEYWSRTLASLVIYYLYWTKHQKELLVGIYYLFPYLCILNYVPKNGINIDTTFTIANYFHWKLVQDTVEDTKTGKRLEELLELFGKPVDGYNIYILTIKENLIKFNGFFFFFIYYSLGLERWFARLKWDSSWNQQSLLNI